MVRVRSRESAGVMGFASHLDVLHRAAGVGRISASWVNLGGAGEEAGSGTVGAEVGCTGRPAPRW